MWIEPKYNRDTDQTRTNAADFNRICGNLNGVATFAAESLRTDWGGEIVAVADWTQIVKTAQPIGAANGLRVTGETDYTNFNAIELATLREHNYTKKVLPITLGEVL